MKIKTFLSVALLSWAAPSSAIIEGMKADASAFPSYASIRTVSPYPVHEGKQMNACGATLVAPRWVLSALHCKSAFEKAADEPVYVGVNIQPDGSFKAKLRVVEVHFAPAKLGAERVDAVLLKLESDATSYGAQVAQLIDQRPVKGTPTVTVGLGQGLEGAPLAYYTSQVTDEQLCDSSRVDFEPAHDFCVGEPGATQRAGYGDSGGPLYLKVARQSATGRSAYRLAGIVKGGVKAGPKGPEETENIRYTDVSKLRDWIDRLTNQAAPSTTQPASPALIGSQNMTTPDASLTNTYWRLDWLMGQTIKATDNRREPHIVLHSEDDNRLAATVGCNRISARFIQGEDTLSFGPIATTKRACIPPLDRLEADMISALDSVAQYKIAGDTLRLMDADGADLARLGAVYLN